MSATIVTCCVGCDEILHYSDGTLAEAGVHLDGQAGPVAAACAICQPLIAGVIAAGLPLWWMMLREALDVWDEQCLNRLDFPTTPPPTEAPQTSSFVGLYEQMLSGRLVVSKPRVRTTIAGTE